jgi:heme oxygenase
MQMSGSATPGTLLCMRQMLRRHTAPLHRKLDSLPALCALLKPALSLSEYHRTLNGYALAYESLEAGLGRVEMTPNLGTVAAYTPRLPALLQDLDQLRRWTGISRRAAPLDHERSRVNTEWHYWGSRYVLEGATQGSRLIALQLRKNLPQLAPRAFAFWELQLRLGPQWAAVCEHLGQSAPQGDARQQLLEGADIAFRTFSKCLTAIAGDRKSNA